jgi:hypothetical protein
MCFQCGNTLVAYCPACHAGNSLDSQYCQACKTPLPLAGNPPVQAQYPAQPPPQQPWYPPQPGYPPYPPQDYQAQPQPPYQPYTGGYAQQPYDYTQQPGYGGGAPQASAIDRLTEQLKHFVRTTNPILLSSLVVLIVGMAIFLVLAFQFGWIKTGPPPKSAAPTDTTPPVITKIFELKEGANRSVIISWVTDEPSSSQVEYGIWPYANTTTPIQYDPTTGLNPGVQLHEVGLTNLLPRTSYIYRIVSMDKNNNKIKGPDSRFDTTP